MHEVFATDDQYRRDMERWRHYMKQRAGGGVSWRLAFEAAYARDVLLWFKKVDGPW